MCVTATANAAQITEHFGPCALDIERGATQDQITAVCDRELSLADPSTLAGAREQRPPDGAFHVTSSAGNDNAIGGRQAPLKSIGECNRRLLPGDTCVIASGRYADHIRPANSGRVDAWITYRATGRVELPVLGHDQGDESGAIALSGREYIRIDGGSRRLFQATPEPVLEPTLHAGVVLNLRGRNLDVIGVEASCPDVLRACTWVASLGLPHQLESDPRDTSNIRLRHVWLTGSASSSSHPSDSTEDTIAISGAQRVLIERCRIRDAKHVAVAIGPATQQIVIRDSRISNDQHTAVSAWGAGSGLWLTGNQISATGATAKPVGGPGNCIQLGASEALITYNVLEDCGSVSAPQSTVGGIICASGPHGICQGTIIAGNTVQSFGPNWGMLDFGVPHGRYAMGKNHQEGNLWMGSERFGAILYWDETMPAEDVWADNIFAGPGYSFDAALIAPHKIQATGNTVVEEPPLVRRFVRRAQRTYQDRFAYAHDQGWPEWMGL